MRHVDEWRERFDRVARATFESFFESLPDVFHSFKMRSVYCGNILAKGTLFYGDPESDSAPQVRKPLHWYQS